MTASTKAVHGSREGLHPFTSQALLFNEFDPRLKGLESKPIPDRQKH
jgi:hypothetical protein